MSSKTNIFIFLLFLAFSHGIRAQSDFRFKRFDLDQGLSMNNIRSITQDYKGFIWVGTIDGLNRYDGYKFKVYKNNPKIKNSLSNHTIWSLLEDSRRNLYVGTDDGGLNIYNHEKDNFTSFQHDNRDPNSIAADEVPVVFEDSRKTLWVGTDGGGLDIFDRDKRIFIHHRHNVANASSIANNSIRTIAEDKLGNIWIGTDNGISILDKKTKGFLNLFPKSEGKVGSNAVLKIYVDSKNQKWIGTTGGLYLFVDQDSTFKHFYSGEGYPPTILANYVPDIHEDKDGSIWIATNFGISIYNPDNHTFTSLTNDVNNPFSLVDNGMNTFYWDRMGNIWVGTYAGLCIKEAGKNNFQLYTNNPNIPSSLLNKEVTTAYQDKAGNIWIALRDGFDRFDRKTNGFIHYQLTYKEQSVRDIMNFYETKTNDLWIGTRHELFLFDRKTGKVTGVKKQPGNTSFEEVWYLEEDNENNLWGCSFNQGIYKLNKNDNTFYPFVWDGKHIPNKDIFGFFIDDDNTLWMGTALEGLYKINKEKGIYQNFRHDKTKRGTISGNFINYIFEDSKKRLWIGTRDGLNLMDRNTNTFKTYTESDGLPNNVINSILEDGNGNLWLGTFKGISKFDPERKTFKNYTADNGLQHNEFWHRSALRLQTGEMIFGGMNGFNLFDPNNIEVNQFVPDVFITDFQIFNKSIRVGDKDSILKKDITEVKEIELSYKHSVFSFEFVALNYVNSKNNHYAYKLKGFDPDWNYVGTQRKATYTNIDPGVYTFIVKGSNNDGKWNEKGTSIKIIIKPPFWQTWWFRSLVIILLSGIIISIYLIRIRSIEAQQKLLEKQVRERTAEISFQKEKLADQAEYLVKANWEIKEQGKKLENLYLNMEASIRAAKVIQESMLPSLSYIKNYLPEIFILYKPKDAVSGDFYWFEVKDNKIIIAAGDCTGHGVSGAFMSIIANELLNHIVTYHSEISASLILNELNQGIKNHFRKNDEESPSNEGLDIALCVIDKDQGRIEYAGAKSPLYICRKEEIIQVKADKISIGSGSVGKFSNNTMEIRKGDVFYLFSDGYADQIGGDHDEKFMYPTFRNLLKENAKKSMEEQFYSLNTTFDQWKGDREQLDDVLVIGFRLS
jgi:ligand-binding sensor domain-containing protein/serine phosphatase RsbU (regulator of sigma subunit)